METTKEDDIIDIICNIPLEKWNNCSTELNGVTIYYYLGAADNGFEIQGLKLKGTNATVNEKMNKYISEILLYQRIEKENKIFHNLTKTSIF